MILNEDYYKTIWGKFKDVKTLNDIDSNASCLTIKFILRYFSESKPIHVNFQGSKELLYKVGKHLFIELANDIYLNHYDLPALTQGIRLRDKRKHVDKKKHDYIIKSISNNTYTLEHIKNKATSNWNYDKLVKCFIPIEQGTRQATLKGYSKFFSDLNNGLKLDFTPTSFEKEIVFLAKKPLWDSIPNKNKIPCSYLPNSREENNVSEIKSIPALQDSLVYFMPKYEICYHQLLLEGKKIKTIVVFDTETDKIEQILQDKARFGFNVIIISNRFIPIKDETIPCWNWFKEEIEIVNAL